VVLFLISQILFFRITGFEELGNTDSFQTNVLEKRQLPEQCPNEPSVVELESFWYNPFTCAG
jgi:hypothetical protein